MVLSWGVLLECLWEIPLWDYPLASQLEHRLALWLGYPWETVSRETQWGRSRKHPNCS